MEFICWYENVAFKQNSAALGSKFPGFVANLQADTSTHWAEPYSRPPQANCQLTTTLPWLQWLSCPSEDPDNRAAYARQTHSLGLWDEKWIYWRVQEKPWFRARNGGRGGAVCIYLRGAPSAISIAVIPKDQISLCGKKHTHTKPGQSLTTICWQSLKHFTNLIHVIASNTSSSSWFPDWGQEADVKTGNLNVAEVNLSWRVKYRRQILFVIVFGFQ